MNAVFRRGIVDPPGVAVDRRATATQSGMANLFGRTGTLPPPQDHRQLEGEALSTMTVPPTTSDLFGNPRAESVAAAIEFKMIFTSLNEEKMIIGPNGVAPLTYTDKHAFEVNIMRWHSLMPDRRPVRGRVRMGTYDRESRVGTLSSYGIGFEMPLQFFMDMDGPMYFRMAIEQINIGVRDFLILLVYNMLEAAIDWGSQMWKEKMDIEGTRRFLSMNDWLLRERRMMGIFQRDAHPVENIINFMEEQQAKLGDGARSNILLANHRIGRFVQTEIGAYNKFFMAGERGVALLNSSPDEALATKFSLPVHVVRSAVIDDVSEFDFMTGHRRYGEYVEMLDLHTQSEAHPYHTDWRTVYIMDSSTDDWQPVTLRDALLASGRFMVDPATGEPTDTVYGADGGVVTPGRGALRSLSDANAGWKRPLRMFDHVSDPFHDGSLKPFTTWRQLLEAGHFNRADVLRVATAAKLNSASIVGIKSELVGGDQQGDAAEIASLAAEINAADYNDEYAAALAGRLGAETLPAFSGRLGSAPPFLATVGGFRAIASEQVVSEATFGFSASFAARVRAVIKSIADRGGDVDAELGAVLQNPARLMKKRGSLSSASAAASSQINTPIAVGAAVNISHDARKLVEQNLTGTWTPGPRGGLVGDAEAVTTSLGRLGLLRSNPATGALDSGASDRNALAALSLVHNYGLVDPQSNPEGTLQTEHMRGLVLSSLAALNTSGTPEQVSARIGTLVNWFTKEGHVPQDIATRQLTTPASAESVARFNESFKKFLSENATVATDLFGGDAKRLNTALGKISRLANSTSPETVRARLAAAAAPRTSSVGIELAGGPTDFVPVDGTSYSVKQLIQYNAIALSADRTPSVQLEDPSNRGAPLTPERRAALVRADDQAGLRGPRITSLQRRRVLITNMPAEVQREVDAFLDLTVDWATVSQFLDRNIPVLLRPIIMRPQIVLATAGMIATATGGASQRCYYSKPLFTWEEDGSQQVSRAVLSFWAGSFVHNEKSTYHLRDLLIIGCLGGFDMTMATGGEGGSFQSADQQGSAMNDARSIIVMVEPYRAPGPMEEIITAYGSWDRCAQVVGSLPVKDRAKQHFLGITWMAMWFGISPEAAHQQGEREYAWGSALAPENYSMWRGGARYFNPVNDTHDDYRSGAGAIAGYWFYNKGMFTAWNTGNAYPAQTSVATMVS
jgi:hypothetical protein